MKSPSVAIIVLNWNGWQDTIECLKSISKMDNQNFNVVIVDNGSKDGSVKKIKEWAGDNERLKIIGLSENQGFAKGNNIGIRRALRELSPEYILVLNNDTVVEKGFLAPLIDALEKDARAALAGPKIIDYYSKEYWQGPAIKRLTFLTYLMFLTPLYRIFIRTPLHALYLDKSNVPHQVYAIPGCCMLFKREGLESIGLFDESTFLGWEEYIVAEKLKSLGRTTCFVPQSVICHKVAKDTKKIPNAQKSIIMLKSEKYFQDNYFHMGLFSYGFIRLVRGAIFIALALVNSDFRRNIFKVLKVLAFG